MDSIVWITDKAIAVKVPDGSSGFMITHAQNDNDLLYLEEGRYRYITSLPGELGQWSILGKGDKLTGEQWKGIVNDISFLRPNPYNVNEDEVVQCWQDYTDDTEQLVCYTATESGLSLLKSKSLTPSEVLILIKQ